MIRQAGTQTDIQANRHAGRQRCIHTVKCIDIQICRKVYRQAVILANIHSYRQQAGRQTDIYKQAGYRKTDIQVGKQAVIGMHASSHASSHTGR